MQTNESTALQNTTAGLLGDARTYRPGPVTGRTHTATLNDGQAFLTFSGNAYDYFTVDTLALGEAHHFCSRALFDMERGHRDVKNLQAVDPACVRFTDAVEIDGCVFTSFALHGKSIEAVKAALSKVWVVDAASRQAL